MSTKILIPIQTGLNNLLPETESWAPFLGDLKDHM